MQTFFKGQMGNLRDYITFCERMFSWSEMVEMAHLQARGGMAVSQGQVGVVSMLFPFPINASMGGTQPTQKQCATYSGGNRRGCHYNMGQPSLTACMTHV